MKYLVAIVCLAAVAVPHLEPYARSCYEQSRGREGSTVCKTAVRLWVWRDGQQHVMKSLLTPRIVESLSPHRT